MALESCVRSSSTSSDPPFIDNDKWSFDLTVTTVTASEDQKEKSEIKRKEKKKKMGDKETKMNIRNCRFTVHHPMMK